MKTDKRILLIIGSIYAILFLVVVAFYLVNPFNNECISGNCINGRGTYLHHSGMKYEGEWKNGKRHGKGKLTYPGVYAYVGEWKNNLKEGYGVISYAFGSQYKGEWKNNKKDGKGIYLVRGRKVEGHWKNNLMQGEGTVTYPGGFKWRGEWKDNRIYSGKGTIIAYDGIYNGNRYEGQAKSGRMFGAVKITYPDGSIFKGELISGKEYVKGTIIYPDGSKSNKTLGNDAYLFGLL